MKIDFNNVRMLAMTRYDSLCKKLNSAIQDKSHDPVITIDPDTIQEDMDELRGFLFAIACSYHEGIEDFKSLGDDIGEIAEFNPDPES